MKHTIEFFRNAIATNNGLNDDERALLFIVPMVQVAWAHAAISPREALVIFEAAREEGIDSTHWFNEKLDSFLVYQPSLKFFEACLDMIRDSLSELTNKRRRQEIDKLLSRCEAVAAAAGDKSLMDVNHGISPEERRLLAELDSLFRGSPRKRTTVG